MVCVAKLAVAAIDTQTRAAGNTVLSGSIVRCSLCVNVFRTLDIDFEVILQLKQRLQRDETFELSR